MESVEGVATPKEEIEKTEVVNEKFVNEMPPSRAETSQCGQFEKERGESFNGSISPRDDAESGDDMSAMEARVADFVIDALRKLSQRRSE